MKVYKTPLLHTLFYVVGTMLCFISFAEPSLDSRTSNLIIEENKKEGTRDWLINVPFDTCGYPDHQFCRRKQVEGYSSHTSIKGGEQLSIFVSTDPGSDYALHIYRMGYYGGKGGRLMKSYDNLKGSPQAIPEWDKKTNFLECKWDTAVKFTIPHDWVSGVYLGKLTAKKDGSQAYVIFIVKDSRKADFLFQCSDLTWQAYNRWPLWHSLYDEGQQPWVNTNGARISFDRPYGLYVNGLPSDFNPLSNGGGEFLLWEYPLSFWMEKEGYDVSYISNVDTHADPATLLRAKGFLSVGHDEYWTGSMFKNVMAARDAGVNLLFLSGNSVNGKVYLEPATDGRMNRVTGRVPAERLFSNEQDLMGASSYGVGYTSFVCKTPDHWLFNGTGMKRNDSIENFVGWEYHGLPLGSNKNTIVVAQNKIRPNKFKDPEAPDHAATMYTTAKGAFVFNAGTCWWSMLLATPPGFQNPVNNQGPANYKVIDFSKPDKRVQQMTKNLLARCLATTRKRGK
ncbi:MAG TPA: N,N-dimethylformamidase beta subunit family domain-containing protein [Flavisolibacter sp.]|nr:N,N-dimethylformamidase beta subunit family domain-containing protein [Flavisolibacter sp.]